MNNRFFSFLMAALVLVPAHTVSAGSRKTIHDVSKYSLIGGLVSTLGLSGTLLYLDNAIVNAKSPEEKAELLRKKNLLKKLNLFALLLAAGGGAGFLATRGEEQKDKEEGQLGLPGTGAQSATDASSVSSDEEVDEPVVPAPAPAAAPARAGVIVQGRPEVPASQSRIVHQASAPLPAPSVVSQIRPSIAPAPVPVRTSAATAAANNPAAQDPVPASATAPRPTTAEERNLITQKMITRGIALPNTWKSTEPDTPGIHVPPLSDFQSLNLIQNKKGEEFLVLVDEKKNFSYYPIVSAGSDGVVRVGPAYSNALRFIARASLSEWPHLGAAPAPASTAVVARSEENFATPQTLTDSRVWKGITSFFDGGVAAPVGLADLVDNVATVTDVGIKARLIDDFVQELPVLLACAPGGINAPDALGRTPLMIATDNALVRVVRALIEQGADATVGDSDGRGAKSIAMKNFRDALRKGAQVERAREVFRLLYPDQKVADGLERMIRAELPRQQSAAPAPAHVSPAAASAVSPSAPVPAGFSAVNKIEGFLQRGARQGGGYEWVYQNFERQVVQANGWTAYAGHVANYRRLDRGELGKPDQDAFFVDHKNGALRICVCDGTGTFDTIETANNDPQADEFVEYTDNYTGGGAAMARFIARRASEAAEPLVGDFFRRVQAEIEAEIAPLKKAFKSRNALIMRGVQPGLLGFMDKRVGNIYGGSSTVAAVTMHSDGSCLFSTVGDAGAIVLRGRPGAENFGLVCGPSKHASLHGYKEQRTESGNPRSDGKWHMGDGSENDITNAAEATYKIVSDDRFLVVACDGLWDVFSGPRQEENDRNLFLDEQVNQIRARQCTFFPVAALSRVAAQPLTPAGLYGIIDSTLKAGGNPADAVVAAVRRVDHENDDVTVVVVDLQSGMVHHGGAADAVSNSLQQRAAGGAGHPEMPLPGAVPLHHSSAPLVADVRPAARSPLPQNGAQRRLVSEPASLREALLLEGAVDGVVFSPQAADRLSATVNFADVQSNGKTLVQSLLEELHRKCYVQGHQGRAECERFFPVIRWLVEKVPSAKLPEKSSGKLSLFAVACLEGDLEMAQWLKPRGSWDLNETELRDSVMFSQPPLFVAVCRQAIAALPGDSKKEAYLNVARWLAGQGAHVNAMDREGRTALMLACASDRNPDVAMAIAQIPGVQIDEQSARALARFEREKSYNPAAEMSELFRACEESNTGRVRGLLAARPSLLNTRDKKERTLLLFASAYATPEMVSFLVAQPEIDLHAVDAYGSDALMSARNANRTDNMLLLASLLDADGRAVFDVNVENKDGESLLKQLYRLCSPQTFDEELLSDSSAEKCLARIYALREVYTIALLPHCAVQEKDRSIWVELLQLACNASRSDYLKALAQRCGEALQLGKYGNAYLELIPASGDSARLREWFQQFIATLPGHQPVAAVAGASA